MMIIRRLSLFLFAVLLPFSAIGQDSSMLREESSSLGSFSSGFSSPEAAGSLDPGRRVSLALSTPSYPVTPGDVYTVSYIGAGSSRTTRFNVDSDYSVDLGFFGTVDATDLSYPQLQRRVSALVQNAYPASYPQVMLLSVGQFKVVVTGAVKRTGELDAWGLTRLSSVVSGQMADHGTERKLTVTGRDGSRSTYDLFLARRDGDLSHDPYVRPGDRVEVGRSERRVRLSGEVLRPGSYELLPGDTMRELLNDYGEGLTDRADPARSTLERYGNDTEEPLVVMDLDLTSQTALSFALKNLDTVIVPRLTERLPVVYLEGALVDPARQTTREPDVEEGEEESEAGEPSARIRVTLRKGDTLGAVLSRSKQYIRPDADLRSAVVRRRGTAEPIEIDMERLLYQDAEDLDVALEAGDRIIIPYGAVAVFVTGEVKAATWVDVDPLTRLDELLARYMTEYSSNRDVVVRSSDGEEEQFDLFRASRLGELEQNPYLQPGDTVIVARAERRVTISGEIERPGRYQLLPGEQMEDLVELYGGGYTALADRRELRVTRFGPDTESPARVTTVDASDPGSLSFELEDLDEVEVPTSLRLLPVVYLDGAMKGGTRIRAQLKAGDTLYSVLSNYRDHVAPNADLTKGFISREGRSTPLEVDMEELLYHYRPELDVELVAQDRIVIPYGNIEVFLTGEVDASQWVTIEPLTRLSNLVAGHLTEYSSNRDIVVRSSNGEEARFDLFRAARLGEKEQNPYLQPGDTVVVQRAERRITVTGEVERPGGYQLLEGEQLADLIDFYGGGFTTLADRRELRVTRYSEDPEYPARVTTVDASELGASTFELDDLDRVEVPTAMRLLPVVYLDGAVKGQNKIRIPLKQGDTLYSVLSSNRGQLAPNADLTKGFISREGRSTPLEVDMEALLYQYRPELDVELVAQDRIVIPYGNIEVFLTGEVRASQWITIEPLTRLSDLVAGHLTEYSSNRDIVVRSSNGEEQQFDLFRAARLGEKEQDPYLQSGDTVIVERVQRRVKIDGEVERPGVYQLLEGEQLERLIEFYGNGLTERADLSGVERVRYQTTGEAITEKAYYDLTAESPADVTLRDRDVVSIPSNLSLMPYVFFEGAVTPEEQPAEEQAVGTTLIEGSSRFRYRFHTGEKLSGAVKNVEWRFSPESDLRNGYVVRVSGEEIEIDLEALLRNEDGAKDLLLESYDKVVVPFKQYFVIVAGGVNIPGRYPYIPDRTYRYYVDLAGGFDTNRHLGDVVRMTDANERPIRSNAMVEPETKIYAPINNPLYYVNQLSGVVGVLGSILSILALTGVFGGGG